jgi:hypothetical protein
MVPDGQPLQRTVFPSPPASRARPQRLSGKGAGQPESREDAVVGEAGDAADAVAGESEDEQPVSVADRGVRVAQVAGEGGLPVRPGGDEPGPPGPVPERNLAQEVPDRVTSLVLKRERRHGEPGVLGEQGDDRLDVAAFERVGELARDPQYQQVVAGQDPLGAGLRLLPWGIAPFLVGPRAGALADRIGARALVVTGSLVQAAGAAWIAAVAGPGSSYLGLIAPMTLIGVGLALAIPAVTRSATSTVLPADIGTASGAFTTMRQLGGAFGVAVLGAVFATTGGYATPAAFSHGFVTAFAAAAGIALAGAAAGAILPGRRNRRPSPTAPPGATRPAAAQRPAPPGTPVR